MSEELHPRERIAILDKRLTSLREGAGEFTAAERENEIQTARTALIRAFADWDGSVFRRERGH